MFPAFDNVPRTGSTLPFVLTPSSCLTVEERPLVGTSFGGERFALLVFVAIDKSLDGEGI